MASRLDFSQIRSLYIGTSSSTTVDTNNLIVVGSVGIGTTAPGSKLQVEGANPFIRVNNTSADDHGIKISYNGSDAHGLHLLYNANSAVSYIDNTYQAVSGQVYGNIYIRQNVGGTMTSRITIKADGGNVGIGTTSPSSILQLGPGSYTSTNAAYNSFNAGSFGVLFRDAYDSYITFNTVYGPSGWVNKYGTARSAVVNFNDGALDISTGSGTTAGGASGLTTKLVMTNGGNVGIGTTSPSQALDVNGYITSSRYYPYNSNSTYISGDTGGLVIQGSGYLYVPASGGSYFEGAVRFRGYIYNDSATYLTINGGTSNVTYFTGNVGIGTTSPASPLQISAASVLSQGVLSVVNTYASGGVYYPAARFVNQRGDHSFGIISEFYTGATSGSDRPSILFNTGNSSNSWQVGMVTSGWGGNDSFGIGYRANNDPASFNAWPTARFLITTDGNVGIGTTSPASVSNYIAQTINGTDGSFTEYRQNGTALFRIGADISRPFLYGMTNAPMDFYTNTNLWMRITSAGNVGIGTTSPSVRLQVVGANSAEGQLYVGNTDVEYTAGVNFTTSGTIRGFVGWRHTNSTAPFNLTGIHLFNTDNSNIVFGTNNLVRAVIDTNGNVGVGTTSPGYKLDVSGAGRFSNGHSGTLIVKHNYSYQQPNWAIKLDGDSGTSGGYLSQWVDQGGFELAQGATYYGGGPWRTDANSTSFAAVAGYGGILTFSTDSGLTANSNFYPSERMRITAAGNVGIGTTSPSYKLDVIGSIRSYSGFTSNGYHGDTYIQNILPAGNNGANTGNVQLRMWCSEPGITWDWAGFGYNVVNDGTAPYGFARLNSNFGQAYMRFSTDGSMYFYNTTTSNVRTTTMTLSPTGNVGIGVTPSNWSTVTPTLQIGAGGAFIGGQGAANVVRVGVNVYYDGSNWRYINSGTVSWFETASGGFGWFNSASGTAGNVPSINQIMTLTASGNLGINTTSPAEKLSVVGNIRAGGNVIASVGLGYGNYISMRHDDNNGYITITRTVYDGNLILEPFANVGISTSSPTEKLHVAGNVVITYNNSFQGINSIGNKAILARVSPTTGIINYAEYATAANLNGFVMGSDDARVKGNIATDSLEFITNGSTQAFIDSSGNVGIGTTSPTQKLDVAGIIRGTSSNPYVIRAKTSSGSNSFISFEDPVNASNDQVYCGSEGNNFIIGTNYAEKLRVNSSGNVGIGTTSISYRVDISGDARILSGSLGVGVAPNATDGRIDASNDIVAYSTSDQRLKENVTPIENALEKVKTLTGVEFDWKEETAHVHGYHGHDVGIIAQDVQAVLPEAVRTNDSGYLSVRYEKMIALLIEGMKEQQNQIDELKAKLDGLTK